MNANNMVLLIGRLGDTPVLEKTKNGKSATQFDIAVKDNYPDANGEYPAEWHKVKIYGNTADYAVRNFRKGTLIAVGGKLKKDRWKTDAGRTATETYVLAESVNKLADSPKQRDTAPTEEAPQFDTGAVDAGIGDDDLPF